MVIFSKRKLFTQIYVQDMAMEKSPIKGTHNLRRMVTSQSDAQFRSGIISTIEQTLMRSIKTSPDLTQGRGISDSVLSKWILRMVFLQKDVK